MHIAVLLVLQVENPTKGLPIHLDGSAIRRE
jgi:hypothetical protein